MEISPLLLPPHPQPPSQKDKRWARLQKEKPARNKSSSPSFLSSDSHSSISSTHYYTSIALPPCMHACTHVSWELTACHSVALHPTSKLSNDWLVPLSLSLSSLHSKFQRDMLPRSFKLAKLTPNIHRTGSYNVHAAMQALTNIFVCCIMDLSCMHVNNDLIDVCIYHIINGMQQMLFLSLWSLPYIYIWLPIFDTFILCLISWVSLQTLHILGMLTLLFSGWVCIGFGTAFGESSSKP